MGSYRWTKVVSFLVVILWMYSSGIYAQEIQHNKIPKILILHSYNSDYKWTQEESKGIKDFFEKKQQKVEYFEYYLDGKRVTDPQYNNTMLQLMELRFQNETLDGVIATDNLAYDFLRQNENKIAPGVPKVACGLNEIDSPNLVFGNDNIEKIMEPTDVNSNMQMIQKLQRNLKKLYVLYDNAPFIVDIKSKIISYFSSNSSKVQIIPLTISELSKLEKDNQNDSALILLPISVDESNQFITAEDVVNKLIGKYNGCIYTMWDQYIGYGTIGGKVQKGDVQGQLAAEQIYQYITKKSFNASNYVVAPSKFVFDYSQVKKHGIDYFNLPAPSVFINGPNHFYPIKKQSIWIVIISILLLLSLIARILLFNIRKRVKIERKLSASKERYQKLITMLPDMMLVLNEHGVIKFINAKGLELLGANYKEEVLGEHIYQFIEEGTINLDILRHVEQDNDTPISLILRTLQGNIIDTEMTQAFINYENSVSSLCVFRDMTDRNLLNEVVEYEKLRNEFFSNLSHELRTPISLMLSTTQLMNLYLNSEEIQENSIEKLRKYSKTLHQNGYRLLRLVNNLIDVTKVDAGFMEVALGNHNIIEIVENITMSIVDFAESKQIQVEFDTDEEELFMACDPDKMERILLNLFSNAIKFTEANGKIEVKMERKQEELYIIIRDSGVGIPKEKLKYIFERFVQVDKSLRRNNEGSGIGLALVKSFVDLHHGQIKVKSRVGKGTQFTIIIPIRTIEENYNEMSYGNMLNQNYTDLATIEFSDIYNL